MQEWLSRAKNIDIEIELLRTEHNTATELLNKYRYKSIYTYRDTLNNRISDLEAVRNEIISAIGKVSDSRLQDLLTMRYIDGMTWECISEELYYCYEYVVKDLHTKALKEIERVIHI